MKAASAAIVVLAAAICMPLSAAAQQPVKSFDQLSTRLKPGDAVWVTDAEGRETKGRILALTPVSLVLDAGQRRTFGADDVRAVRERVGRALGKAALWGVVAGAGAGVALAVGNRAEYAAGSCPPEAGSACWPQPGTKAPIDWWSVPVYAGLGAGLGTVVGALLPGKARDVYRAPSAAGAGASAHLSVGPLITPRRKALVVSIAF